MCVDFNSVRECVNPRDLYSRLQAQRLKSCIVCPALWSLFVKHNRIFFTWRSFADTDQTA